MLGPRLSRPLRPPAHSGPTVQMTITRQGAVAHLEEAGEVGEEEEDSTPLVDWSSEEQNQCCRKSTDPDCRTPQAYKLVKPALKHSELLQRF